ATPISYGLNTVAALGDINGDGFDDFATCHVEVDISSNPTRYVIFGKKDLSSIDLGAIAAGTGGFIINGGLTVLATIASAGDVNGDGLGDIIVGNAPLINAEMASYVIFGKTNPANVDLNAVIAGTGGFAITSPSRQDTAWAVSSAGDFNGDGLSDILIGATGTAAGNSSDRSIVDGKVFVIFGRTDTAPVRISNITSGTGGFVISGPTITHTDINQSNYTGFSISAAGDVNGDGLADIIIGATGESSAGGNPALVPRQTGAGNAYVVFGTNSRSNINLDAVANGTGGFLIRGESINDHAGYNVNAAGDINGDGLADLLVGAPFADELFGLVYVVYGKTNTQIVDL
ncbi:MAG: integrin alpha, partial [Methylophilaceae bacterium]|nr:integrin alpha [Methylophilaceae bacterium]